MKGNVSTSASAVLSAAGAMVTLSMTVTTTVLTSISLEESNDGTLALSLPSPLKKTRKTSHQQQRDCQNGRKGKDTYALALSRVTTLIAAKRNEEKENDHPTATVIAGGNGGGSSNCDSDSDRDGNGHNNNNKKTIN